MTNEQQKALLRAQQGELDAVFLYQKLAKKVKTSSLQKQLLQIAADEGKHAAILRGYTGQTLVPSRKKAIVIGLLYSLLGPKKLFPIMAKGEKDAVPPYEKLAPDFPRIREIMQDELKHASILEANS